MQTTLKKIRESRGISQAWLAQQLGIHRVTLARYESGIAKPSKSLLFHTAYLLHISPKELLEYDKI